MKYGHVYLEFFFSVKPGSSAASVVEKSVKVAQLASKTVDAKIVKSEPKTDVKPDEKKELPEKVILMVFHIRDCTQKGKSFRWLIH